jgi:selenocysteine-specific elongation factor
VRLLDADRLAPGAEGWVQILLEDPIPMVKGDFFVIRSSEDTLGGGQVVDPNPRRRHRRFDTEVIERLMMLDQGTGEDIIISVADQWGPCTLSDLSHRANLSVDEALERVSHLAAEGEMVVLGDPAAENDAVVYSTQGWTALKNKALVALQSYHSQYPLRRGAPAQEIRSRLGLSQSVYQRVLSRLAQEGHLVEEGQQLRLPDHQVTLSAEQERRASAYLQALEKEPYSPPTEQPIAPELLNALMDQGKVVKVNDSVVFAASAYQDMLEKIIAHLKDRGSITVAEARTIFNSSRKYMLPLLEYLDQQRITRRTGDERVLR